MRALLVALVITSAGCATRYRGIDEALFFDSVPPGAEFEYRGKVHTTPCLVNVHKADSPVKLEIYKRGFAPAEVTATASKNIWFSWSILELNPITWIVDGMTNSWSNFKDLTYRVQLAAVSEEEANRLEAERAERGRKAAEAEADRQRRWREARDAP